MDEAVPNTGPAYRVEEDAVLRGGPMDGYELRGAPKCDGVCVPVIDPASVRMPPIDAPYRFRSDERWANVEHDEWWDEAAGKWVPVGPAFIQARYERTGETDAEGRAVFAFVPDPRGQTQTKDLVS